MNQKEIQEKVDARERAQEACDDCGGPTKRREVKMDADGDTAPELICLDTKCGWRG